MNKEIAAAAASGVASGAGIGNSIWLWLLADPAAHVVTILTGILVCSQIFWGWKKFMKGDMA